MNDYAWFNMSLDSNATPTHKQNEFALSLARNSKLELVGEGGEGSYQQLVDEGEEGGDEISTLCLQMHKLQLTLIDLKRKQNGEK